MHAPEEALFDLEALNLVPLIAAYLVGLGVALATYLGG
jgi:hypothetical protein